MAVLYVDDFNRANESPMAGDWTIVTGLSVWTLNSNQAVEHASSDSAMYVNTVTPPDDQYAKGVFANAMETIDGDFGIGVAIRIDTGAETLYFALGNAVAAGEIVLGRIVAGAITILAQYTAGTAPIVGDEIMLQGESTTLKVFHNGTERISQTDSAIASGRFGIMGRIFNDFCRLDDFEGGSVTEAPPDAPMRNSRSQLPPNVRMAV